MSLTLGFSPLTTVVFCMYVSRFFDKTLLTLLKQPQVMLKYPVAQKWQPDSRAIQQHRL